MMSRILQIGYLLVPFSILSLGNLVTGHRVALFLIVLAALGSRLKSPLLRYYTYYFVAWHLFVRLRLVFDRSLNVQVFAKLAQPTYMYHAIGLLIILLLSYFTKKRDYGVWYAIICAGAFLQVIIGFAQYFGYAPFFEFLLYLGIPMVTTVRWDLWGTMLNPNFMAMMVSVSIPFFFYFLHRGQLLLLVPVLVSLTLLKTTTSMIALAAGMVVFASYYMSRVKTLLVCMGIAICGCVYVVFYDPNIFWDQRWWQWKPYFQAIFGKFNIFIFGYGPGAYYNAKFMHLHNEWLQVWFELGTIGFLLPLAYILTVSRKNKYLFSALVIFAVNAIGGYPLRLPPNALLGLVIIGLIESEGSYRKWPFTQVLQQRILQNVHWQDLNKRLRSMIGILKPAS